MRRPQSPQCEINSLYAYERAAEQKIKKSAKAQYRQHSTVAFTASLITAIFFHSFRYTFDSILAMFSGADTSSDIIKLIALAVIGDFIECIILALGGGLIFTVIAYGSADIPTVRIASFTLFPIFGQAVVISTLSLLIPVFFTGAYVFIGLISSVCVIINHNGARFMKPFLILIHRSESADAARISKDIWRLFKLPIIKYMLGAIPCIFLGFITFTVSFIITAPRLISEYIAFSDCLYEKYNNLSQLYKGADHG